MVSVMAAFCPSAPVSERRYVVAAKTAERKCPNCAAPIDKMGSTGVCGYCNTKVTTGDFGWVLATELRAEISGATQ
jgi:Zn finger protein HypA/HybF involved in hydrogenase expression